MSALYPQIGHVFTNLPTGAKSKESQASSTGAISKRSSSKEESSHPEDSLIINVIEEGNCMLKNMHILNLKPQVCLRERSYQPINLYHKVGHGKLDMYVINPAKEAKELKEFMERWDENSKTLGNFRSGIKIDGKELWLPLANLVSICALLVWIPENPDDAVTRLLFPGSTPQHKILRGLDRLRSLEFIQNPTCLAGSLPKEYAYPSSPVKSVSSRYSRDTSSHRQYLARKKEKEEKSIKSEVNADQKAKHEAEKRERLAAAAKKREKMKKQMSKEKGDVDKDKKEKKENKTSEEKSLKEQKNQKKSSSTTSASKTSPGKLATRTTTKKAEKVTKTTTTTTTSRGTLVTSKVSKEATNKTKKAATAKPEEVKPAEEVKEDKTENGKEEESIVEKHQLEEMEHPQTAPAEKVVKEAVGGGGGGDDDIEPELQRIKDDDDAEDGAREPDIPAAPAEEAQAAVTVAVAAVAAAAAAVVIEKEVEKKPQDLPIAAPVKFHHIKTPDEVDDLPEHEAVEPEDAVVIEQNVAVSDEEKEDETKKEVEGDEKAPPIADEVILLEEKVVVEQETQPEEDVDSVDGKREAEKTEGNQLVEKKGEEQGAVVDNDDVQVEAQAENAQPENVASATHKPDDDDDDVEKEAKNEELAQPAEDKVTPTKEKEEEIQNIPEKETNKEVKIDNDKLVCTNGEITANKEAGKDVNDLEGEEKKEDGSSHEEKVMKETAQNAEAECGSGDNGVGEERIVSESGAAVDDSDDLKNVSAQPTAEAESTNESSKPKVEGELKDKEQKPARDLQGNNVGEVQGEDAAIDGGQSKDTGNAVLIEEGKNECHQIAKEDEKVEAVSGESEVEQKKASSSLETLAKEDEVKNTQQEEVELEDQKVLSGNAVFTNDKQESHTIAKEAEAASEIHEDESKKAASVSLETLAKEDEVKITQQEESQTIAKEAKAASDKHEDESKKASSASLEVFAKEDEDKVKTTQQEGEEVKDQQEVSENAVSMDGKQESQTIDQEDEKIAAVCVKYEDEPKKSSPSLGALAKEGEEGKNTQQEEVEMKEKVELSGYAVLMDENKETKTIEQPDEQEEAASDKNEDEPKKTSSSEALAKEGEEEVELKGQQELSGNAVLTDEKQESQTIDQEYKKIEPESNKIQEELKKVSPEEDLAPQNKDKNTPDEEIKGANVVEAEKKESGKETSEIKVDEEKMPADGEKAGEKSPVDEQPSDKEVAEKSCAEDEEGQEICEEKAAEAANEISSNAGEKQREDISPITGKDDLEVKKGTVEKENDKGEEKVEIDPLSTPSEDEKNGTEETNDAPNAKDKPVEISGEEKVDKDSSQNLQVEGVAKKIGEAVKAEEANIKTESTGTTEISNDESKDKDAPRSIADKELELPSSIDEKNAEAVKEIKTTDKDASPGSEKEDLELKVSSCSVKEEVGNEKVNSATEKSSAENDKNNIVGEEVTEARVEIQAKTLVTEVMTEIHDDDNESSSPVPEKEIADVKVSSVGEKDLQEVASLPEEISASDKGEEKENKGAATSPLAEKNGGTVKDEEDVDAIQGTNISADEKISVLDEAAPVENETEPTKSVDIKPSVIDEKDAESKENTVEVADNGKKSPILEQQTNAKQEKLSEEMTTIELSKVEEKKSSELSENGEDKEKSELSVTISSPDKDRHETLDDKPSSEEEKALPSEESGNKSSSSDKAEQPEPVQKADEIKEQPSPSNIQDEEIAVVSKAPTLEAQMEGESASSPLLTFSPATETDGGADEKPDEDGEKTSPVDENKDANISEKLPEVESSEKISPKDESKEEITPANEQEMQVDGKEDSTIEVKQAEDKMDTEEIRTGVQNDDNSFGKEGKAEVDKDTVQGSTSKEPDSSPVTSEEIQIQVQTTKVGVDKDKEENIEVGSSSKEQNISPVTPEENQTQVQTDANASANDGKEKENIGGSAFEEQMTSPATSAENQVQSDDKSSVKDSIETYEKENVGGSATKDTSPVTSEENQTQVQTEDNSSSKDPVEAENIGGSACQEQISTPATYAENQVQSDDKSSVKDEIEADKEESVGGSKFQDAPVEESKGNMDDECKIDSSSAVISEGESTKEDKLNSSLVEYRNDSPESDGAQEQKEIHEMIVSEKQMVKEISQEEKSEGKDEREEIEVAKSQPNEKKEFISEESKEKENCNKSEDKDSIHEKETESNKEQQTPETDDTVQKADEDGKSPKSASDDGKAVEIEPDIVEAGNDGAVKQVNSREEGVKPESDEQTQIDEDRGKAAAEDNKIGAAPKGEEETEEDKLAAEGKLICDSSSSLKLCSDTSSLTSVSELAESIKGQISTTTSAKDEDDLKVPDTPPVSRSASGAKLNDYDDDNDKETGEKDGKLVEKAISAVEELTPKSTEAPSDDKVGDSSELALEKAPESLTANVDTEITLPRNTSNDPCDDSSLVLGREEEASIDLQLDKEPIKGDLRKATVEEVVMVEAVVEDIVPGEAVESVEEKASTQMETAVESPRVEVVDFVRKEDDGEDDSVKPSVEAKDGENGERIEQTKETKVVQEVAGEKGSFEPKADASEATKVNIDSDIKTAKVEVESSEAKQEAASESNEDELKHDVQVSHDIEQIHGDDNESSVKVVQSGIESEISHKQSTEVIVEPDTKEVKKVDEDDDRHVMTSTVVEAVQTVTKSSFENEPEYTIKQLEEGENKYEKVGEEEIITETTNVHQESTIKSSDVVESKAEQKTTTTVSSSEIVLDVSGLSNVADLGNLAEEGVKIIDEAMHKAEENLALAQEKTQIGVEKDEEGNLVKTITTIVKTVTTAEGKPVEVVSPETASTTATKETVIVTSEKLDSKPLEQSSSVNVVETKTVIQESNLPPSVEGAAALLSKEEVEKEVESWGKPLGLPSPVMPGTPKKTGSKESLNAATTASRKSASKKSSSSSSTSSSPVYLDLAYVPHHGDALYTDIEFFKRVRARYYVFSGVDPSREVFDALLEAKKTWDEKDFGWYFLLLTL